MASMMVGYGDAAHAGKVRCNYSLLGVLQYDALRRYRAKPSGRREKYIRRWFDIRHIQTGNDNLEVMSDTETGQDTLYRIRI